MPIDRTPIILTMLSSKLQYPVSHFNKSGIWPGGLIVCASLHEQNVIFYANIIMAHLNRPYECSRLKWPRYIFEATCTVGITPQCPHPTPPLAMFGCEKPILRPCTNSFNIHNSIFNKFNDFNQVRCPNKSCYIKIF
jgi:hypothetical protein